MRISLDTETLDRRMTIEEIMNMYKASGVVFKDEKHDFGWALKWLKRGNHVARQGWKGEDMCIFLIKGRIIDYNTFQSWKNAANRAFDPPVDIKIADHIDMKAADGTYVTGWLASQTDMLAEDWFIVR